MKKSEGAAWICLPIPTQIGEFRASYSASGLAELRFPANKATSTAGAIASASARVQQWHRVTNAALNEILSGRAPGTFPPLDLSAGTKFQQSVWRAMTKIPFGHTTSYGELARDVGKPRAGRAVGSACGANPIPVLVPCHRVLAADNRIGGFSGGLDRKRDLLKREGVTLL